MSLAESSLARGPLPGFKTQDRVRWVHDFRVEGLGYGASCFNEEDETLPLPVRSKDLFRESENLPSSDGLQFNIGRFLHHHRYRDVNRRSRATRSIKRTEAKRAPLEQAKPSVQISSLDEILEQVKQMLETTQMGTLDDTQADITAKLKNVLHVIHAFQSRVAALSQAKTVLESFDGYVDSIDGDTAYVTLESRENGDVFYGEYSASELLAMGIREQTRFLCETVKGGDGGRVRFVPLPKVKVTDEEARAIAKEMREAFPGDDDSVIKY